jgi:hypothetical protein
MEHNKKRRAVSCRFPSGVEWALGGAVFLASMALGPSRFRL